ncbi:hypothetical protein TcWFU_001594 [Taenia crassiceps]|uniref:Uncharacterized protein n=1 Tax=Taenia crassiceps TaxID=6207 RepID=A0ABR4QP16_9CEST
MAWLSSLLLKHQGDQKEQLFENWCTEESVPTKNTTLIPRFCTFAEPYCTSAMHLLSQSHVSVRNWVDRCAFSRQYPSSSSITLTNGTDCKYERQLLYCARLTES